jgi:hypothetical protein
MLGSDEHIGVMQAARPTLARRRESALLRVPVEVHRKRITFGARRYDRISVFRCDARHMPSLQQDRI